VVPASDALLAEDHRRPTDPAGPDLCVSPSIKYLTKEKVVHANSIDVTAKRERTIMILRVVGVLVLTAGGTALTFASRKPQQ